MKPTQSVFSALSVAMILALVACSSPQNTRPAAPAGGTGQQAASAETIKIGAVVPLTGRYAALGSQVRPGYEIAVDDVNAAGGVDVGGAKRMLELKIQDDESDPAKTVQRLESLASADKVVAYLGGAGSDLHAAGAAIGDKNKIPYLGIAFGLNEIHQRGLKYLFSPFPKSPDIARTTFELAGSIPQAERPQRYAIFHEKTDWGLEMSKYYNEAAQKAGAQIVLDEEYAPGTKDLSDVILKAKTANADALLGMPSPPDGITIVKQMKELDWNPKLIMLVRAPDDPNWGQNLGKDGDYVLHMPGWHHAAKFPGVTELNAKYQAKFNRPADVLTGPSYALVQILADAIHRAGKADGTAIRDALASTDLKESVIGPVKFNPDGTGVIQSTITQWQNSQSQLVWPRDQQSAPLAYPAPPFSQR
ncbi:MAG TPA: amino acid ABC transporter substrate-binding protein [Chloroflexota bacterium]|jgi:branched-chain amino acid transport system substrate-binding protein